jgi:PhnB protein
MSRVSTYLNFAGNTEEAFGLYRSIFGTEFSGPPMRMGEMPAADGTPSISDEDQNKIAHIELPILAGHVLMATDMLESMGQQRTIGNNVTINLEPDTRDETDRIYDALSEGGSDATGLQDMPWGAYWGVCLDRYGIRWMFNCYQQPS